jgi:hypothetical protein
MDLSDTPLQVDGPPMHCTQLSNTEILKCQWFSTPCSILVVVLALLDTFILLCTLIYNYI